MTLKELMATLPGDEEIAVGCSSAYHYIGTAAHFLEVEGRISTVLLESLVTRKNRAQTELKGLCDHGVPPMKREEGMSVELYAEQVRRAAERLKTLTRHIQSLTQSIAEFTPLIIREVRSVEKTPVYGKTQILLNGDEAGAFWFQEEYDHWERTGKTTLPAPKGISDESDD